MRTANRTRKAVVITSAVVVALLTGCAETARAPSRIPDTAQSKRLGLFVHRINPFYADESGATDRLRALFGESQDHRETVEKIRTSGVYDAFEKQFIKEFSGRFAAPIERLKGQPLVGQTGTMDPLASAKSQRYDLLFEAEVWPCLQKQRIATGKKSSDADYDYITQVKATLKVTYVSDGKVLWKVPAQTATRRGWSDAILAAVAAEAATAVRTAFDSKQ